MENLIELYASKFKTEPEISSKLLVSIARAESNFDKYAFSRANAMGVFQLTPVVLLDLSKRFGLDIAPFDIESSVEGAKTYLAWLARQFPENYPYDITLILASWNWGIENVKKWLQDKKKMPKETEDFIERVMNYYETSF